MTVAILTIDRTKTMTTLNITMITVATPITMTIITINKTKTIT